jgi:hypothetical protein
MQSGCSFLVVSGPPSNHASLASFDCSESNAVPVLDTIWAALNGIGAISAAGDSSNPNQGQIIGVGLSWLAISGAAAIYGYTKVSQCKAARREREERFANSGDPASPPAPMPAAAPPAPAAGPAPSAAPGAVSPVVGPAPSSASSPASPTSSLVPGRAGARPPARTLAMRSALIAD